MNKEETLEYAEKMLNEVGYTLPDLILQMAKNNASSLHLRTQDRMECFRLYSEIEKEKENGGLSRREKGEKLEELTTILFEKSVENIFQVHKNCRTSTNEIDLLVRWTEQANLAGFSRAYSFLGDSFLCECKNYDGPVNVTYVGKFCSLMTVTETNFGVIISWDGVTGRGKWSDSAGLIKKFALSAKKYIIVLEKNDLKQICEGEKTLFSLLRDRYLALKDDINYEQYIMEHEAEQCMMEEKTTLKS